MPELSAPNADRLRHDAGKIGIHHPGIEGSGGAFGYDIDDSNIEFSHVYCNIAHRPTKIAARARDILRSILARLPPAKNGCSFGYAGRERDRRMVVAGRT